MIVDESHYYCLVVMSLANTICTNVVASMCIIIPMLTYIDSIALFILCIYFILYLFIFCVVQYN